MSDDIPEGLPFSQAYLRPAEPVQDDSKFRRRLAALFDHFGLPQLKMAAYLKLHGGIPVPHGYPDYDWDSFFLKSPISDVLDAIGLIFNCLSSGYQRMANQWKSGVAKILEEQSIAYRLDDACAVRRLVDSEFDRTRLAAIAGLGAAKFKVAKDYFDAATQALERTPADTAEMVRNVFLANEEVFKLMFPAVDRLVAGTVRNHLKPENCVSTLPAITASKEMVNSFVHWVIACQQYRHAPGETHDGHESPAAPPLDLAIVMMSAGASFLRWLVALN